mmetsp:Transcript_38564/g.101982  ORF Transcript_38564/g.101982 Transcript_38564/m.101982 type:complete len:105 (+) Transcript_38564:186-500(+)
MRGIRTPSRHPRDPEEPVTLRGPGVRTPSAPRSSRAGPEASSWAYSEAVMQTMTPQWNDERELSGYAAGESLSFLVFNGQGRGEPDLLGEAVLLARYVDHYYYR